MKIKKTNIILRADEKRVLLRPFEIGHPGRVARILSRIMSMEEDEVRYSLNRIMNDFADRHRSLKDYFLKRFAEKRHLLPPDQLVSETRKLLIGAYFTHEYSLEAAALFNPSIVWHPDQSGLPRGSRRFILSLRAVGEGHISSITFRSGIVDSEDRITMDDTSRYVTTPLIEANPVYDKHQLSEMILDAGIPGVMGMDITAGLGDTFTLMELEESVSSALEKNRKEAVDRQSTECLLRLARSNYRATFDPQIPLAERVLFPASPGESNGMEDARFVAFQNGDGAVSYCATYTAYDGHTISPQLLETRDFECFKISTLTGAAVHNKGMALFPRKVNGHYAMLGRQDNENIFIMFSDDILSWHEKEVVLKPEHAWEFIQTGNCGSPMETDAGWLVLSHGVGPMRQYFIGAFLLDLENPARLIGRVKKPLLSPNETEREGYVPNVVYSCGGIINRDKLILPYGFSDSGSGFALIDLNELLREMTT